jgi:type IV secretory pathway TraG/TraD family ATPase VirD4
MSSVWNLFTEPDPQPRARPANSFWNLFANDEPADGVGTSSSSSVRRPPCATVFDPDCIFWAMQNLPATEAVKHFLSCGTTASGKTTGLQLFLQSIAPRFKAGHPSNEQLIVFDAKGDMVPTLAGLGLPPTDKNVWILNPFDERAAVWDLGDAINTPGMARYLATFLVPPEKNSTAPYYYQTAQEIVTWVAIVFMQTRGKKWTLRDLLNALDSKERIEAITDLHPRARAKIHPHLHDEKHTPGVLSSLSSKLGGFEEVAALWHTSRSKRRFSIADFLKNRGVLVLGHDPVLQESLWPINAIMLRALTNEILRQPNTNRPRHWFVLDEFRAMERVDAIRNLLNLGRSKGAAVTLGTQSVEGLIEIYQEHATNEILGLCSTKTFLRAGGHFTAEWAERHFNKVRHIERSVTESYGAGGRSTSVQYQVQERSLFLPSMFLDLPLPELGGPFETISDIPVCRCSLITRRLFDDVVALLKKPDAKVPGVILRTNPDEQIVQPWSAKEERDFCNTTSPETPKTPKKETRTKPVSREEQRKRRRRPPPKDE